MDTSGPADTLSSTETAGTGTPITSGDVTATFESTTGGKSALSTFVIGNYIYVNLAITMTLVE